MKSYEIVIGIAGESLFLGVPKATDEGDALQQVYNSDQVNEYEPEEIENLEVIEISEEIKK